MEINEAVKIFKNLYDMDIDDGDKLDAIDIVTRNMAVTHKKVTKADLYNALDYMQDIWGK